MELRMAAEYMVTTFPDEDWKCSECGEKDSYGSICGYHMAESVPRARQMRAECGVALRLPGRGSAVHGTTRLKPFR
jgi:hypothetical protein